MTELENDNYAFPGDRYAKSGISLGPGQGMTMRDWFAGQALPWAGMQAWDDNATVNENARAGAVWAYAVADAMIAARNSNE